eukprot:scaffold5.g672.t1
MRAVAPALSKLLVRAFAAEASLARSPSSLPKQHWYTVHEHERLISPLTRNDEEEEGVFESHHPSQRFAEVLSNLRKRNTVAIDIAVGAEGRVGVELSRRGFHAIGIEADATLLARTFRFAQARAEGGGGGGGGGGCTAAAGRRCRRPAASARKGGLAPAGEQRPRARRAEPPRTAPPPPHPRRRAARPSSWDLSSEFMCELESLFERYNPHYRHAFCCRFQAVLVKSTRTLKQRDIEQWGERLTQGNLFRLQEYSVHPNPLRMRNAAALLDILDCMSFVRSALRGSQRKAFNADARAVVAARYGREPFDLPLETKMYVLEKNEHCAAPPMGVRPHH